MNSKDKNMLKWISLDLDFFKPLCVVHIFATHVLTKHFVSHDYGDKVCDSMWEQTFAWNVTVLQLDFGFFPMLTAAWSFLYILDKVQILQMSKWTHWGLKQEFTPSQCVHAYNICCFLSCFDIRCGWCCAPLPNPFIFVLCWICVNLGVVLCDDILTRPIWGAPGWF